MYKKLSYIFYHPEPNGTCSVFYSFELPETSLIYTKWFFTHNVSFHHIALKDWTIEAYIILF